MAPTSVLVVANRTASTPQLLDEIARQARDGAHFSLIVPPEEGRAGAEDWTGDTAAELVGRAAGGPVEQIAPGADPLAAVHEAVDAGRCDAIILSVPEAHLSRFIHHDLRHRLEHLGTPVTGDPAGARHAAAGPRARRTAGRLVDRAGDPGRRRQRELLNVAASGRRYPVRSCPPLPGPQAFPAVRGRGARRSASSPS